jgi:glycolate oxidase
MDIAFPEISLNLMREIKKVFDPNGILNPGKIF